jgi:hypothetical protein
VGSSPTVTTILTNYNLMNKNYECTKTNPFPKGTILIGSWDNPKYRHPDSVLVERPDNFSDVYFCPNCKQKIEVYSEYYMDCIGAEMELNYSE